VIRRFAATLLYNIVAFLNRLAYQHVAKRRLKRLIEAQKKFKIMKQLVESSIHELNKAAAKGKVTIVDIPNENLDKIEFDDDLLICLRLYSLSNASSWNVAKNHVGLYRCGGDGNRIFYLSTYSLFDRLSPGATMTSDQLLDLGLEKARFWFENRQQAILFKLKYG
jgi:hypothetical protein